MKLEEKGVDAVKADVAHERFTGTRKIEAALWLQEHDELSLAELIKRC